jgi:hypothetical protein
MRTPLRPIPEDISRWIRRARQLRWLDAAAAWLGLWAIATLLRPEAEGGALAVLAAIATGVGVASSWLRRGWRPVTALTAVVVGWRLRPGDRAWHVWPDGARPVLVTSRRWRSVVIAGVVQDSGEGVVMTRTRALLVRAEKRSR